MTNPNSAESVIVRLRFGFGRSTPSANKHRLTAIPLPDVAEAATLARLGNQGDEDNGDGPPGPTTEVWDMYDQAIAARDATRRLIRIATRTIDRNTPNPPYLTSSEKRRLECVEPDCHDYATNEGRCETHHLAHHKAQRAHNAHLERLRYHKRKDRR